MFLLCLSIWVIPESLLAQVIYIIYLSTPLHPLAPPHQFHHPIPLPSAVQASSTPLLPKMKLQGNFKVPNFGSGRYIVKIGSTHISECFKLLSEIIPHHHLYLFLVQLQLKFFNFHFFIVLLLPSIYL